MHDYTKREREKKKEACRGVDFETSLGTAWYDTSWNLCYHVINDRNGSCQVLGSRLYESGFSHGFESSARDIQTATLQKQAPRKKGNGPKRMTLGIPWVFVYPPDIRIHIRPWKVAVGRWGNTLRMGWWDMLVHPMSLEISQVRSPTTKAGFTYLKLQSFLPRH